VERGMMRKEPNKRKMNKKDSFLNTTIEGRYTRIVLRIIRA